MNNGYTVVEPPSLSRLFGNPKCFDFAVLVLHWIAYEAGVRLGNSAFSIEVIRVEYLGAYPALGVRGTAPDDIVAQLESLVDILLKQASVEQLIEHAISQGVDWRKLTSDILA